MKKYCCMEKEKSTYGKYVLDTTTYRQVWNLISLYPNVDPQGIKAIDKALNGILDDYKDAVLKYVQQPDFLVVHADEVLLRKWVQRLSGILPRN